MVKCDWIWMDGVFKPDNQATMHFLTHSLHYSGSVFEGIRCYNTSLGPAIFRLEDHIVRLFDSAKIVNMKTHWKIEDIINVCIETVKKNNLDECYIRPLLYYGTGEMGLGATKLEACAGVAVWKWGTYLGKGLADGVRVMTSSWRKSDSLPIQSKVSANYLLSRMAKEEAQLKKYDEAILLDPLGYIAEGPGENVFVVKNNALYTPPATFCLKGITRDTILKLAQEENITIHIENMSRDFCYTSDEMFFTGTAAEVTPIVEYDDRKIGKGIPGTITQLLQTIFFKVVKAEQKSNWLTYIK